MGDPAKGWSFVDDNSDDDKKDKPGWAFVDDEPAAPKGASGIAPSTEEFEPQDKRPQWVRGLMDAAREQEDVKLANDVAQAQSAGPVLGGLIYGASAHTLDPLKDERMQGTPRQQRAAEWTGAAASPLNLVGGAAGEVAAGAGPAWLRGLVGGATGGAVNGGLTSAITDRTDNPDATALSTLAATGRGVGAGAAAGGVFGALSDVGRGVSDLAQGAGDWFRQRAYGLGEKQLGAFADRAAGDALQSGLASGLSPEAAQLAANRAGASDNARRAMIDRAEKLVPPNDFFGRGPGRIQNAYADTATKLNPQIENYIDQATAAGAQLPADPRGQVAQNMYQAADNALYGGFTADQAPALSKTAFNVQRGPQSFTPQDVRAQKIGWDQQAFKGEPGTPQDYAGRANLAVANEYRGMLGDYMDQAGPQISGPFRSANEDYGLAATIRDASKARGEGLGGPANAAPWQSAMNFGVNVATGGGAGPDFAANMSRLGQNGADAAVDAFGSLSNTTPAIAALASAGGFKPQRPSNASDSYTQSQANDSSKGYQASGRLQQILNSDPSQLGPYAEELSQIEDPEKAIAAAERLYNQEPDKFAPYWARISGAAR